jgi:hypothetical protein
MRRCGSWRGKMRRAAARMTTTRMSAAWMSTAVRLGQRTSGCQRQHETDRAQTRRDLGNLSDRNVSHGNFLSSSPSSETPVCPIRSSASATVMLQCTGLPAMHVMPEILTADQRKRAGPIRFAGV